MCSLDSNLPRTCSRKAPGSSIRLIPNDDQRQTRAQPLLRLIGDQGDHADSPAASKALSINLGSM
jgi:hypothetical protein